jgi:Type VI secretion system VasI, EvfG, VC_A0118
MQCPQCGLDNQPGSHYCVKCGGLFNAAPRDPNTKSNAWKWALGIFAGIFLVSIILSVISQGINNPQPSGVRLSSAPSATPDSAPPASPAVTPASEVKSDAFRRAGKWQVSSGSSAMDDSPGQTLTLQAENQIQGWLKTETPTLLIRCRERKIDLIIHVGMSANVEYGGGHTVRVRLDDRPPEKQNWSESTNNEALFAPRPLDLARRIAAAERMRFEFVPFNASPAIVEFDVHGLKEKLAELEATCGKRK